MWEQVWFFFLCGPCNYLPLWIFFYSYLYLSILLFGVFLWISVYESCLSLSLLRVFLAVLTSLMCIPFLVLVLFLYGSLLVSLFLGVNFYKYEDFLSCLGLEEDFQGHPQGNFGIFFQFWIKFYYYCLWWYWLLQSNQVSDVIFKLNALVYTI